MTKNRNIKSNVLEVRRYLNSKSFKLVSLPNDGMNSQQT